MYFVVGPEMWKNAAMDIAVIKKLVFAAVVFVLSTAVADARTPENARGMPGPPQDFRRQDRNGFSNGAPVDPAQEQVVNNHRRGKLSPDERRELRRQIDEAGQDIYRVKR